MGEFVGYSEFEIVKHSPNIIDLIEENDYVNGNKVVSINGVLYVRDEGALSEIEIKSIVTKEQFNSVMYKVGDENEWSRKRGNRKS